MEVTNSSLALIQLIDCFFLFRQGRNKFVVSSYSSNAYVFFYLDMQKTNSWFEYRKRFVVWISKQIHDMQKTNS
ncbi:unnamed protein product, partial [Rotaria magnacalcarata]